jgi:hypothetical protein
MLCWCRLEIRLVSVKPSTRYSQDLQAMYNLKSHPEIPSLNRLKRESEPYPIRSKTKTHSLCNFRPIDSSLLFIARGCRVARLAYRIGRGLWRNAGSLSHGRFPRPKRYGQRRRSAGEETESEAMNGGQPRQLNYDKHMGVMLSSLIFIFDELKARLDSIVEQVLQHTLLCHSSLSS